MSGQEKQLLLNSSSSNITQDVNYFQKCTGLPMGYLFWSGFSAISIFLGTPASLFVLWELLQRRRRGVFIDIFMLNLSFIDLTFTFSLLPIICNYMVFHSFFVTQVSAFIHGLPLCGRPLFMACICGDCYFAVVHPIMYKTSKNAAIVRKLATLVIWLTTIAFGSVFYNDNGLFSTPLVSIPLIVALPVISFCDVSVLRALKKTDPSGKQSIHPKKRRALHTILNSFVMTFTVYLPPAITFSFAKVFPITTLQYFCTLTFYGICFCIAGCVIMPVLYLDTLGKFDHFKTWLRKC